MVGDTRNTTKSTMERIDFRTMIIYNNNVGFLTLPYYNIDSTYNQKERKTFRQKRRQRRRYYRCRCLDYVFFYSSLCWSKAYCITDNSDISQFVASIIKGSITIISWSILYYREAEWNFHFLFSLGGISYGNGDDALYNIRLQTYEMSSTEEKDART